MKALVLDGYTDEPACLGVPPYISPYVRLAFGALEEAGADVTYGTIDQWRAGSLRLEGYGLIAVVRNVAVPGRYLRGMPASDRELQEICHTAKAPVIGSLGLSEGRLSQALKDSFHHIAFKDLDAGLFEIVKNRAFEDRRRTVEEWNSWLVRGAKTCDQHPDLSGQLIAEVQMYRGCVRYASGGCRFCIEPLFGEVVFRNPDDILAEVEELARHGVRNFRLGAQSCVYCYMSEETGTSETPTPNTDAVTGLLRSIRENVSPEIFHLDNANPAVIAEHPDEAREITKAIAEYCTSGNVLAFGLESADPKVAKANNLNATADQTLEAIRIVNQIGSARGRTGLPAVLPGLNFVCGLFGETRETYALNLEFLKRVLDEGLMLRRINIRQVLPSREEFEGVRSRSDFERFKRAVREQIDLPMLERLVPDGTVLASVYAEVREGGRTFGRQVGTYPLLVDIPYALDVGRKLDVAVVGRGFRSVIGIAHPTDVNTATLSMLESVPGIGKKTAMAIVRNRPFRNAEDLWSLFQDPKARASAQFHLTCRNAQLQ